MCEALYIYMHLPVFSPLRQVLLSYVFHLGRVRDQVGTQGFGPRAHSLTCAARHLPDERGLFNILPQRVDFLGCVVSVMLFTNIFVLWEQRKIVPPCPL